MIDETSFRKWGRHTPGVQRQYLGCVGKVDNGIVTVHLGVGKGRFHALLDADLYLPKSWAEDRPRCRAADVPDAVRHLPEWRLAVDHWLRAAGNGVAFDWLTFDEGYGAAVPYQIRLDMGGLRARVGSDLRPSTGVLEASSVTVTGVRPALAHTTRPLIPALGWGSITQKA